MKENFFLVHSSSMGPLYKNGVHLDKNYSRGEREREKHRNEIFHNVRRQEFDLYVELNRICFIMQLGNFSMNKTKELYKAVTEIEANKHKAIYNA